jgi:hypothetical protein
MNWKEFLKPSVGKLIIPIILLTSYFISVIITESQTIALWTTDSEYNAISFLTSSLTFLWLQSLIGFFLPNGFVVGIIISAFLWYVISAFSIGFWKKGKTWSTAIILLFILLLTGFISYLYTSGCFGCRPPTPMVGFDSSLSFCNSTGISVFINNIGTKPFLKSDVNLGIMTKELQKCNATPESDDIVPVGGTSVACDNIITGQDKGFNVIVINGTAGRPINSLKVTVSC